MKSAFDSVQGHGDIFVVRKKLQIYLNSFYEFILEFYIASGEKGRAAQVRNTK
jgi:hypothetical protein